MASTTKRHPARITAAASADAERQARRLRFLGRLQHRRLCVAGDRRSPIACRCMRPGPIVVPHVRALTRAIHTNDPPSGAFRGFGVPQAAIAHEALMDMLADKLGMDRLEFRLRNAHPGRRCDRHRPGARGERRARGVPRGAAAALEGGPGARGWPTRSPSCGAARASPACGTASATPRFPIHQPCAWGSSRRGGSMLYNGAVDIGQGSNTIMIQIAADALGVAPSAIRLVMGDTDLTEDAGKTSASRQTFVSGKAARAGGAGAPARDSETNCNAGEDARIELGEGEVVSDGRRAVLEALRTARADNAATCCRACGSFDPPTTHARSRTARAFPMRPMASPRRWRRWPSMSGSALVKVLTDGRRPRCRQGDQPDAGRRTDPWRHRPGAGLRAHGGICAGAHREPARLPDPDVRRHAGDRDHPDRGCRAARTLRRQGHRRAGADPDRAGDPLGDRECDRGAHHPPAGDARPRACGAQGAGVAA